MVFPASSAACLSTSVDPALNETTTTMRNDETSIKEDFMRIRDSTKRVTLSPIRELNEETPPEDKNISEQTPADTGDPMDVDSISPLFLESKNIPSEAFTTSENGQDMTLQHGFDGSISSKAAEVEEGEGKESLQEKFSISDVLVDGKCEMEGTSFMEERHQPEGFANAIFRGSGASASQHHERLSRRGDRPVGQLRPSLVELATPVGGQPQQNLTPPNLSSNTSLLDIVSQGSDLPGLHEETAAVRPRDLGTQAKQLSTSELSKSRPLAEQLEKKQPRKKQPAKQQPAKKQPVKKPPVEKQPVDAAAPHRRGRTTTQDSTEAAASLEKYIPRRQALERRRKGNTRSNPIGSQSPWSQPRPTRSRSIQPLTSPSESTPQRHEAIAFAFELEFAENIPLDFNAATLDVGNIMSQMQIFGQIVDDDSGEVLAAGPDHFGITQVMNEHGILLFDTRRQRRDVDAEARSAMQSMNQQAGDVIEVHVDDDVNGAAAVDAPSKR